MSTEDPKPYYRADAHALDHSKQGTAHHHLYGYALVAHLLDEHDICLEHPECSEGPTWTRHLKG